MNSKTQDFRKWMEVTKNKEISRRILYSLKLSLRMLNGQFSDYKIYQVNSSSLSFDQKFKDKITLECWYKPTARGSGSPADAEGGANDEIQQIAANGGLSITPGKPKVFTAGAIVENPDEIFEGQVYWFYLFKVVVGKSYCHRRRDDERKGEDLTKVPLPPGYDSVYLEGESPRKLNFNHHSR